MTSPRYVSPCHGAECEVRGTANGYGVQVTSWHACSACGQPCDPMDADLRDRIVAEGMKRAADIAEGDYCNDDHDNCGRCETVFSIARAIRREAGALRGDTTQSRGVTTQAENRQQSTTGGNGSPQGGATDGREPA